MRHEIKPNDMVTVRLESTGHLMFERYLSRATKRALGKDPDVLTNEREGRVLRATASFDRHLPLWELIKILGPHQVSSQRQLIDFITVEIDDQEHRALKQDRDGLARALKRVLSILGALEFLAQADVTSVREGSAARMEVVGGTSLAALGLPAAPVADTWTVTVMQAAETWARECPEAVPYEPGLWWLDNDVVRVDVWGEGDELVFLTRNNRRHPVASIKPDRWGGLALRDPRIADAIPF
jgi:hypothetical protein